ncbi:hypothetical protein B0O80DRAFT_466128 [Mortierella sp. GBAus27b]|nr:hypothetical protein B0O80DRAFT_466128 [Mortierella sp. GBAus27b]
MMMMNGDGMWRVTESEGGRTGERKIGVDVCLAKANVDVAKKTREWEIEQVQMQADMC